MIGTRSFKCHFCGAVTHEGTKWSAPIPFQAGDPKGRKICITCIKKICATPGVHRAESIDDLRKVKCPDCGGHGEILQPYAKDYGTPCQRCRAYGFIFKCPTPLELLAECADDPEG